jgi:hypothetical protein
MDASKPRWLRFSLRTMFAAFTVCALFAWGGIWLAGNASFVRQRREALTLRPSNFSYRTADSQSAIPMIRRAMGDKAIAGILLGTWASDEELERANQLFPEATVKRNDPFWERFLEWGPNGL